MVLFALNGFKMSVTPFSVAIAVLCAVDSVLYVLVSIKSFNYVNLSAYSVSAMMGGMLIPFAYGNVFCKEALTIAKLVCCVLATVSVVFTIDFKPKSSGAIYYPAVFILNGINGVFSIIHQSTEVYAIVDSFSFFMLARIISTLICLPYCIKHGGAVKRALHIKPVVWSLGYAAFCGIGNLLLLIALKHIPASVQYPIITGGVTAVSLVISLIRHEKVSGRNIAATVLTFAATVAMAF